jgi:hypothetical protein
MDELEFFPSVCLPLIAVAIISSRRENEFVEGRSTATGQLVAMAVRVWFLGLSSIKF